GRPVGRAERRGAARRPLTRGLVVHPEPPEVIVSEPPRIARAAWAVVGLLWVVALLNYFDRQLVTTMGWPIKAEFGIADAQFGLFSSVFLWVYGVCSPV